MADNLQEAVAEITKRYQPEIDRLQEEGKQIEDDTGDPGVVGGTIGVDFDVQWKDHKISFDVPQFTLVDKSMSLDLPSITMDRQRIVFDTPSVRMVMKKIGQYPEFHGLTVVWKDILTKVPETFMERQEIIYDLPRVEMKRQDFVLKIPQITMGRVEWVLRLPEFTVKNVKASIQQAQQRGEELKAKGEDLAKRMKRDIDAAIASFFSGATSAEQDLKTTVSEAFDGVITNVGNAIKDLQAKGCDPIKVPTDQGDVNLRKTFDDLVTQRDRTAATLAANEVTPPTVKDLSSF